MIDHKLSLMDFTPHYFLVLGCSINCVEFYEILMTGSLTQVSVLSILGKKAKTATCHSGNLIYKVCNNKCFVIFKITNNEQGKLIAKVSCL